jgi:hypothetical protein
MRRVRVTKKRQYSEQINREREVGIKKEVTR